MNPHIVRVHQKIRLEDGCKVSATSVMKPAEVTTDSRTRLEWINYHHLLYFRTVAREGSITRASQVLSLAQPTISGQIRALEDTLGERLFARQGRNLVLTEFGRLVYRYADEIFTLGQEMTDVLKGRPTGKPQPLHVGVANVLPKLVVRKILHAGLELPDPVQMVCREGQPEQLFSELAMHELDLVLSDAPISPAGRIRAFNHLLGTSGVTVFGKPTVAEQYKAEFPKSLDNAPFLLPTSNTTMRRSLDHWFDDKRIRPRVVAEFQDSALLKTFGQSGAGLFVAPTVVERDVEAIYDVVVIERIPELQERFYAISAERRFKNPAVEGILAAAQADLFASNLA
jgi:LysR family transcriptional regulator, transcriptional activator of nhaA